VVTNEGGSATQREYRYGRFWGPRKARGKGDYLRESAPAELSCMMEEEEEGERKGREGGKDALSSFNTQPAIHPAKPVTTSEPTHHNSYPPSLP
jgi:hypothetical protein